MAEDKKKWVVKDHNGKVRGPYSTNHILQSISSGVIGGEEKIARYPNGEWQAISKNPEFYDRLLDILAQEADVEVSKLASPPPPPGVSTNDDTKENRAVAEGDIEEQDEWAMEKTVISSSSQTEEDGDETQSLKEERTRDHRVVDLGEKKEIIKKGLWQRLKLPLFAIFLIAGAAFYLFPKVTSPGEKIHLRVPKKHRPPIGMKKARKAYEKASRFFVQDTFDGYWQAQNVLVAAIEGAAKNKKLRSLLCLVHRELWPHSYQDSEDLKKFEMIAKRTSAMDPGGRDGALCEISLAIARDKYGRAGTLAKAALLNYKLEPVLYEVQAVILGENEKKYQEAIDYLRTIKNLSPKWVKPYRLLGQYQLKLGKVGEALQSFNQALKLNPEHAEAKIQIGIIHQKYLRKEEKAIRYLSEGLHSKARLSPNVKAAAYKSLGEIYIQRKNFEKARKYLEQAHNLNPAEKEIEKLYQTAGGEKLETKVDTGTKLGVGDEYFRRGEYVSAGKEYHAIFQKDPKNAKAAFKAAQCFWHLNQPGEAFSWLDRAIKADPKYIEAYVKKAEYHIEHYSYRSADRVLKRALKLAPRNHLVYQGYALLHLRRQDYPLSIRFATKALRLYETDVESLAILVRAYLGLETQDGYSRAYEKAVQLQSLDQGNPRAQIIYVEALEAVQNIETALAKARGLIDLYPYTVDFRILYGKLLAKKRRFAEAEVVFKQVLQAEEKNKEAFLELAKVLQAQGKFNEAQAQFLQAALIDPADHRPVFLLGKLYLQSKRPGEAIEQFEKILAKNPLYPQAHYYMGQAAKDMGDLKRAIAEGHAEARVNPNRPEPQLLLAETYFLQRDYSNCIASYQKAIKLGVRKDATTYIRQAKCMRLAGDPSTAKTLLKQGLLLESGNPDAWKEMGAICEMLGDMSCAVEGYRQYFNLVPGAKDRQAIENRMMRLQGN